MRTSKVLPVGSIITRDGLSFHHTINGWELEGIGVFKELYGDFKYVSGPRLTKEEANLLPVDSIIEWCGQRIVRYKGGWGHEGSQPFWTQPGLADNNKLIRYGKPDIKELVESIKKRYSVDSPEYQLAEYISGL